MYIVSGWTNLRHIENAISHLGLHLRNHIIWRYDFGVYTQRKFVTSHYHILYLTQTEQARPTFRRNCRFDAGDRTETGGSAQYADMESVWSIPRDRRTGQVKNADKLPDALVEKMIDYSTEPGDLVADFFLGNFTSAVVARRMGRHITGFEVNPAAYHHFMPRLLAPANDDSNVDQAA